MRFFLSFAAALVLTSSAGVAAPRYAIEEVMLQSVPTLVKRATIKTTELGPELGKILPSVAAWCEKKHVSVTGAPFARYHKFDLKGETVLEAGLPAITAQPLEEGIEASSLPAGRAITTRHVGSYESIGAAYDALHAYMEKGHLEANGGPWEVYLNDPTQVPQDEILTQIYYPVK